MQREWFADHRLVPGKVLFAWQRPFMLAGYTGAHSVVLFRSPKSVLDDEPGPPTRIDLAFKPVYALNVETHYAALTVRVATEERAAEILTAAHRNSRVLELIGPSGPTGHIVCGAVGCHEDDGGWGDPSPFAAGIDLRPGRF